MQANSINKPDPNRVSAAIGFVDDFKSFNDQRPAEGPWSSINLSVGFDREQLEACMLKEVRSECTQLFELEKILEKCNEYAITFYVTRTYTLAIPQLPPDASESDVAEHTQIVVDLIEPIINKLKEFKLFISDSIPKFRTFFEHCASLQEEQQSDDILEMIVRFVDMIALLDAIKDVKTCFPNDNSTYNKFYAKLQKLKHVNVTVKDQTNEFFSFLTTQRWIFRELKKELAKVKKGSINLLFNCANHCVNLLKGDCCIMPNEFFRTLRGVSLMLLLVSPEQYKAEKKRLPSMKPYIEFLKQYPCVPLYGDMHFKHLEFIAFEETKKMLLHEDPKLESVTEDALRNYRCTDAVEGIKKEHHDLVSQYSVTVNRLKEALRQPAGVPYVLGAEVNSLVLRGIRLISRCARTVHLQISYKYANPTQNTAAAAHTAYQKALRDNCTKEEFIAIIEILSIAKSLANTILRDESLLFPVIRRTVHTELHYFVDGEAAAVLHSLAGMKDGGKKGALCKTLHLIVSMFSSSKAAATPAASPADAKRGSKKAKSAAVVLEKSVAVPTSTQLSVLRAALSQLLRARKDLPPDFAKQTEACYTQVRNYWALLHLVETIAECSDMSDLWYREFYLDICKKQQFPVSDSLPSILLTHLFDAMDDNVQELTELILYPFAIYNDAADRALRVFKQRHLYDEIEAEANLCFDQFLFQLSVHLVRCFVARAASVCIDQVYRTRPAPSGSITPSCEPPIARFGVITEQRTVRLLGRVVNLNAVLGQRVNAQIKERIEHAIASFEASDLRTVAGLDLQLRTLRTAHALLSKHFELEPFDLVLSQQNQSFSLAAYQSRILTHVICELVDDIAPNYCYNTYMEHYVRQTDAGAPQRTPAPRRGNQPYGTQKLGDFLGSVLNEYNSFFGRPHISAMLRVLRASEVPVLVTALQDVVYKLFDDVLSVAQPLLGKLGKGELVSRRCRSKEFFQKTVSLVSPLLGNEGFSALLELLWQMGNIIAFINLLDKVQRTEGVEQTLFASPFVGANAAAVSTRPSAADIAVETAKYLCAHPEYQRGFGFVREAIFSVKTAVRACATPQHASSLFKAFLSYVKEYAKEKVVEPQDATGGVACAKEFYRVWTLAESAACLQKTSFRTKSGDGFVWAGVMLTCILGQNSKYKATSLNAYIAWLAEDPDSVPAGFAEDLLDFFKNVAELQCLTETVHNAVFGVVSPLSSDVSSITPPNVITPNSLN